MITVSLTGVLIGILLIALIVLVVFLIVLVSNATDTIKKTNAILDGGTAAAKGAKAKVDGVGETIRDGVDKARGFADTGVQFGQHIVNRIIK